MAAIAPTLAGDSMSLLRAAHPVRSLNSAGVVDRYGNVLDDIGRELRSQGAEVIQLGYNRSIQTVVTVAGAEGVHGVAVGTLRGDNVKHFTRLKDRLISGGAGHVQVFGVGGTVSPVEILVLKRRGVTILAQEDGQCLDLVTTAKELIQACAWT
jgi:methylmalonyl-CoA mutase